MSFCDPGFLTSNERKIVVFSWIKMIENECCIYVLDDIKLDIFMYADHSLYEFDPILTTDGIQINSDNTMIIDNRKIKNQCGVSILKQSFQSNKDYQIKLKVINCNDFDECSRSPISIGIIETDKIADLLYHTRKYMKQSIRVSMHGILYHGNDCWIDMSHGIINYENIKINDYIGCVDTVYGNFTYNIAKIIDKNDDGIKIHWIGWSSDSDEIILKTDYHNRIKLLKTPLIPFNKNDIITVKYTHGNDINLPKIQWFIDGKTKIPKECTLGMTKEYALFVYSIKLNALQTNQIELL